MYKAQCVSILELTKLIGLLLLTVQAVFPGKIQFWYPQQLQIQTFKQNYLYRQITIPHAKCKQELKWWIKHFELSNGKRLKQFPPQIIIQTDASLTGWEEGGEGWAVCQSKMTNGTCSVKKRKWHNSFLGVISCEATILDKIFGTK